MAMNRIAWQNTPYAKSDAKSADAAFNTIFAKYKVESWQFIQGRGPHGRPAFGVRFIFKGFTFRHGLEALDVSGVEPDQLLRQIKRAIYWDIKSKLEMAGVFQPVEEVMFSWLELADGSTPYEISREHLKALPSGRELASTLFPRALPPSQ
jgi:hypothetical protein